MEKNKVINATKWSVISEVIAKVISPVTTIILARLLSQEIFGIVASITAITSLADLLTDAGFNAYIIQHQFADNKEKEETYNVCFWSNLSISIVLYVLIFVFRNIFAKLVGAEGYGVALAVASIVLLLTSVSSIEQAIMKKELRFKNVGLIKVVSKIIPFLTTIPLALLGFQYWALIIGTLVGEIVNVALCLKFGGFHPQFFYNFDRLKDIFSFSIWAFGESILEWLLANVAVLTIGSLYGIYYLGVFKTGISIISQITTSVYSLYANVYKSAISREQNSKEGFRNIFLSFQKYASIFSIPIGVGAFLYRDLITSILLGAKWSEATTLIGIWGITSMFSIAFGNFYSDAIRAKGHPKKLVFIDSVYLVVILIILSFGKLMSFNDFCMIFCLAKIVQPFLQVVLGQKVCEVKFFEVIKNCFPQLISTCGMALVVIVLKTNQRGVLIQILSIVGCIVFYFSIVYLLSPNRNMILLKMKEIQKRS